MYQCLSEKVSTNAQSLPQWGGPDIMDEDPPRLWMPVEKRVRKFVERDQGTCDSHRGEQCVWLGLLSIH